MKTFKEFLLEQELDSQIPAEHKKMIRRLLFYLTPIVGEFEDDPHAPMTAIFAQRAKVGPSDEYWCGIAEHREPTMFVLEAYFDTSQVHFDLMDPVRKVFNDVFPDGTIINHDSNFFKFVHSVDI